MSRGVAGALLGVILALLTLSSGALAADPLPVGATKISLVAVESNAFPLQQNGTSGEVLTFAWALFNGESVPHDVNVTSNLMAPGGSVVIDPEYALIGPGGVLELYLNITPAENFVGTIQGDVTLIVTNRTTSVSESVTFTVTAVISSGEVEFLPTVIVVFAAIAMVIFIGFFAGLVFERTKIPDLLILIFVGLILGPFLAGFLGVTIVPHEVLELVTPYFAALALVIILFDGGLNLNFDQVLRKINIAVVHTMVAFFLTVIAVAAVAHLVLGYPPIIGVLLGAIVGGISGAVVINLVRVMSVSKETETLLTLEAVLTDVLCIIVALALIQILQGGGGDGAASALGSLAAAFSIALFIALFFGIFWLKVLKRLYGQPFSFMITIAALFLLYGVVEFVGGSGAMAGLMFGLVLGNKEEFARMFKMKTKFVLDEKIKQFHSELSFVVRTFFFVFLGLVFTLDIAGPVAVSSPLPFLSAIDGTVTLLLVGVVAVFLVIVAVRYVAATVTVRIHPESRPDKTALWIMMGRGLAPAVLASVPFTIPAFTDPGNLAYSYYHPLMAPYQTQFLSITSLLIILTVIATTIGVVVIEKRHLGRSPLETAQLKHQKRMESQQKKAWKKKQLEAKRQRIRREKHRKELEQQGRRRKKLGE